MTLTTEAINDVTGELDDLVREFSARLKEAQLTNTEDIHELTFQLSELITGWGWLQIRLKDACTEPDVKRGARKLSKALAYLHHSLVPHISDEMANV